MADNTQKPDIAIVGGAGHVGLPLALVLAEHGMKVAIYDKSEATLKKVAQGVVPFTEKGAEPLLESALKKDRLLLSHKPEIISGAPVVIITIGTPVDEFLSPVFVVFKECMDELTPYLTDGQLIVLRSTVYPGTTAWLDRYLKKSGKKVKVAFCPERVVQGQAIEEVQKLPQIISGMTPEARDEAAELFERIAPEVVPLEPMEAEFAKLFNNAYRYIEFAIANQFYVICKQAGVDYMSVLKGMSHHYPRAANIPKAGFAAGPCLFKDTMQLAAFANNQFSLGTEAMLVNEGLVGYVVDEIAKDYDLETLKVGLLGMSFKADIDDTRSSLSYKLKKILKFRAAAVYTTDPHVTTDPHLMPLEEVVDKSDLFILCVPHSAYRDLDLKNKPVIDIWGFLTKKSVSRLAEPV